MKTEEYLKEVQGLKIKVENGEHVVLSNECLTCETADHDKICDKEDCRICFGDHDVVQSRTEEITTRALLRKTELDSDKYGEGVDEQIARDKAEADRIGQIDAEMDRQRERSTMPEYTEY